MSDEEVVAAVREHPHPAVTPTDVAEALDVTNTGALQRLDDLRDRGILRKKRTGASAVVFWLPESEQKQRRCEECGESVVESQIDSQSSSRPSRVNQ